MNIRLLLLISLLAHISWGQAGHAVMVVTEKSALGTAFFIGHDNNCGCDLFATARHVVAGDGAISISRQIKPTIPSQPVRELLLEPAAWIWTAPKIENVDDDIAVIAVPARPMRGRRPTFSTVAPDGYLQINDPLHTYGFISHVPWTKLNFRLYKMNSTSLYLFGPDVQGQSGGPLLDRFGSIVGLNATRDSAISMKWVLERLRRCGSCGTWKDLTGGHAPRPQLPTLDRQRFVYQGGHFLVNGGVELSMHQILVWPNFPKLAAGVAPMVRASWNPPIPKLDVNVFADGYGYSASNAVGGVKLTGFSFGVHVPLGELVPFRPEVPVQNDSPRLQRPTWRSALRVIYAGISLNRIHREDTDRFEGIDTQDIFKPGLDAGVRWNLPGRPWAVSAGTRIIPGTSYGTLRFVYLGFGVRVH